MKKRILIPAVLIVLITLVAVPFVFAGPRGGGHGRGGHMGPLGMLLRAKQELNLSDAQVDQIKTIFRTTREQNKQYREQLRDGLHGAAETLIANPNDLATAQALLDRQAAAERAMKSNLLTATSKALAVLTPDQRAKLGDFVEEHRARRESRGRRR